MSAVATATPMADVLRLQRSAYLHDGIPSVAERRDRIDRFLKAVVDNTEALIGAIHDDFGHRAEATTLVTDLFALVAEGELQRSNLSRWMKPRYPHGRLTAAALRLGRVKSEVQPTPLGVVGVMGMWNFPLNLTAIPAISALAAGNRVMIKMSERVPATSEVLAEALHDAFDVTELAVVTGGVETSQAFAALDFDHLFFTGSGATGAKVMAAAAANLTPVTLELGGKNPVVISPDTAADRYSLVRAASRIAAARIHNAGQVCLSPDQVFVPASSLGTFVHEVSAAWMQTLPTQLQTGQYTALIDEPAFLRAQNLLEDAHENGAQVLPAFLLEGEDGERLRRDRIFPPTMVVDVNDSMKIAEEEHFAPILIVRPYQDLFEVTDVLSREPSPLVSTWFGADDADFRAFVHHTRSGSVVRNDWALSNAIPGLPFGGVGASGMGTYHGKFGFDTFSHQRAIVGNDNKKYSFAEGLNDEVVPAVRKALEAHLMVLRKRLRATK